MINLVNWKVAQGSRMFSSPERISCFFFALTAFAVSKQGIDISLPGNLSLLFPIRVVYMFLHCALRIRC